MKKIYIVFLVLFYPGVLPGQQNFLSPTEVVTKTGFYLSTSGNTPYLNRTNQYGLVPIEAQTGFFNVGLHRKYDSTYTENKKLKPWGYSYGIEAHANLGGRNNLLLPIAHISARYKGFELYIGRKREYLGLADTTGTWGSFIWSGNALPLPKIQISTPNYVSLAGKGFLSTKLGFSHGWFGGQNYTENYFLHQKWIYLKLGRESAVLNLIGGLNQNAQWGGYSEVLKEDSFASKNGYFASDAFAYLNVVLPLKIWKRPDNRYSPYEMAYRFGNHLGTIDLGLRIRTGKGTLKMYRQTPWEDGQAPEVFFSGDGNYTFIYELKYPGFIRKLGVEFLNTQRQAYELSGLARMVGLREKHPGEFQNYMNHGQYLEGWSYQERGMGSSAIIPYRELSDDAKMIGFSRFTRDNRIIAPAINVEVEIDKVYYTVHSGYILSSGIINNEREEKLEQFSLLITGQFRIPRTDFYGRVNVAWDKGRLYGNQTGVNLALIKQWK